MHLAACGLFPHELLTMTRRTLLFLAAAGIAMFILWRTLPRAARPLRVASGVSARAAARPQLVRRAAYPPRASEAAPREPEPDAAAAAAPSALPELDADQRWLLGARKLTAQLAKMPEWVEVRREDGTYAFYRPDEWGPDSGQIISRKFKDGRVLYYAGPDAGPPSDPAAFVPDICDLAGPDNVAVRADGVRERCFLTEKDLPPGIVLRQVTLPDGYDGG